VYIYEVLVYYYTRMKNDISNNGNGEKTFPCILIRDFWSFERDHYRLISEKTGHLISLWAHAWIYRYDSCLNGQGVTREDVKNYESICNRWNPVAPAYPIAQHFNLGRKVECTKAEMNSWLALSKHPSTQV